MLNKQIKRPASILGGGNYCKCKKTSFNSEYAVKGYALHPNWALARIFVEAKMRAHRLRRPPNFAYSWNVI